MSTENSMYAIFLIQVAFQSELSGTICTHRVLAKIYPLLSKKIDHFHHFYSHHRQIFPFLPHLQISPLSSVHLFSAISFWPNRSRGLAPLSNKKCPDRDHGLPSIRDLNTNKKWREGTWKIRMVNLWSGDPVWVNIPIRNGGGTFNTTVKYRETKLESTQNSRLVKKNNKQL